MDIPAFPAPLWFTLLALLGLCIGSFLNVVVHRLPLILERQWRLDSAETLGVKIDDAPEIGLAKPASRCPACGHQIAWYENVPVVSYLLLRGKCSACRARISPRYPALEVATAVLFALVGWRIAAPLPALVWCLFIALLLAQAVIDWDTTLLPDSLTLGLLWTGLVASAAGLTVPLADAVWGAVVGYGSLWSVYWLFKLTTGKEGMGYGDFKLLAALGAWLGVAMVLPVVLAASILGAVVGIGMKVSGSLREGRYVPFGPFLAGAGIAVFLLGRARVLDWLGWA